MKQREREREKKIERERESEKEREEDNEINLYSAVIIIKKRLDECTSVLNI